LILRRNGAHWERSMLQSGALVWRLADAVQAAYVMVGE